MRLAAHDGTGTVCMDGVVVQKKTEKIKSQQQIHIQVSEKEAVYI